MSKLEPVGLTGEALPHCLQVGSSIRQTKCRGPSFARKGCLHRKKVVAKWNWALFTILRFNIRGSRSSIASWQGSQWTWTFSLRAQYARKQMWLSCPGCALYDGPREANRMAALNFSGQVVTISGAIISRRNTSHRRIPAGIAKIPNLHRTSQPSGNCRRNAHFACI